MTHVLCRRDRAEIGQPKLLCCKPITRRNTLDWCEQCRARLPLWPQLDRVEGEEILRDLRYGTPDDGGTAAEREVLPPRGLVILDHDRAALEAA